MPGLPLVESQVGDAGNQLQVFMHSIQVAIHYMSVLHSSFKALNPKRRSYGRAYSRSVLGGPDYR